MDDVEQIRGYYACENSALDALHEKYFKRLWAFLRRDLTAEDAEDVVEETFLNVIRTKTTGRSRFDPLRSPDNSNAFWNWLSRIASNMGNSQRRREGRYRQRVVPQEDIRPGKDAELDGPIEFADAKPTAEQIVAARQIHGYVRECQGGLRPQWQEVLDNVVDGETLAKIAERLGIRWQTVATWVRRARELIRKCLEGKGLFFLPKGSPVPPGAVVIMTLPNTLLIQLSPPHPEDRS